MTDSLSSTPVIPHNREAEEATIGSVLIDNHCYEEIQFLRPDDFYVVRHRWIWEAFASIYKSGEPIDFVTVTNYLEKVGQLSEIGGPAYLTSLLNQTPTSLHGEAYAKIVHVSGVRRRLLYAANEIAILAYKEPDDIEDLIEEAEEAVNKATSSLSFGKDKSFSEYVSEYYDVVVERSKQPNTIIGFRTGLIDFDRLTGGIKNKYYLFGGRPGDNKTSLMLNFLLEFAKSGKRVLYVSLEQEEEELTNLLISIETEIDNQRTETGRLMENEWPTMTHAVEVMDELGKNIIFETRAGTIPTIRARIEKTEPDIVIIDSLGFLRGHDDASNEAARINGVGRDIKLMQKRIQLPVLVVHHMNRSIESADRAPRMSDLNEGGEKDCDVLAFIRRPKDTVSGGAFSVRRITLVKHRGGQLGEVDLSMKDACTKFFNAETRVVDLTR